MSWEYKPVTTVTVVMAGESCSPAQVVMQPRWSRLQEGPSSVAIGMKLNLIAV